MGDLAAEPSRTNGDGQIKVLVTGYGPFHQRYPVNASWSIATSLPTFLPATSDCPGIKIIVPSEPIEVAYHTVVDYTGKLLTETDADIIVHIGLAAGRTFFALERQSYREKYWEKKDIHGRVFSREDTQKLWPRDDFPAILKPTFDCEDVWARWRLNVSEGLDVRNSDDPGNYLCGFIYYYSMAWFWGRGREERPVVFMHTPDLPSAEKLAQGTEVAIGLIRALVASREKNGICDPLKGVGAVEEDVHQKATEKQTARVPVAPQTADQDPEMAWTYKR